MSVAETALTGRSSSAKERHLSELVLTAESTGKGKIEASLRPSSSLNLLSGQSVAYMGFDCFGTATILDKRLSHCPLLVEFGSASV